MQGKNDDAARVSSGPRGQAIPLRSVSLLQQRDGLTLENGFLNSEV